MLRTYPSGLSPAAPSGTPEIITTTPVIVNQITSIKPNSSTPYHTRDVNSLLSPSVFPAATSFSPHVTTSAANPALFSLEQRVENSPALDGAHELKKLLKLKDFIVSTFTVTADISGSTDPVVTHFKNSLINLQERGDNITKTMSRKAKKTFEINIKKIKRLFETVDDKSIGEFLQKILAIHQAKNGKMLQAYFKQTDMYMEVYVKDNNTEQLRMLWQKIIYEGDNSLRDYLAKFNLWGDFMARVKHMLETFDDETLPSFIDRQHELYDELKTLCAPSTPSQEKDNLHLHDFCAMPLDDKSVTAAIESLQQNQGLIFVLGCTEYGGKLLEQLNNYKILFAQDTRVKREKEIEIELKRVTQECKTSQKSKILKSLLKYIPFYNEFSDISCDLNSKLQASRTFGLDISASLDSGLKSIYDVGHAGVWKSLNELLTNEKILNKVISSLGITPEVNMVTPEFMTKEPLIVEALCVAHNLYSSRVIADNMSNLAQLYRVMREKFLQPEIIQDLTFNCTDHEGDVVIKALMLAAVWQCSAAPEIDWSTQLNILLGFADEKHARDINATEQTVTVHENHTIRHYVKIDHLDKIKEYLSNRINKKTLSWKFKQSIKLDIKLIRKIDEDVTEDSLKKIASNLINFVFCEGDYSDADFRTIIFRTKLASLLKVAPQKLLSDLGKINYTPPHHFAHHANQSGSFLTEKQISNVDHLAVIYNYLQEMTAEIASIFEHLETLEYIISITDLVGLENIEPDWLTEQFIAKKTALMQQPFNRELKNQLKILANIILDSVSQKNLITSGEGELITEIPAIYNYFSSYRPKDIDDFYAWMEDLGLPLSNAGRETISQELGNILNNRKSHPDLFCEIISLIVRDFFSASLLSDQPATSRETQRAEQCNTLSTALLEQIKNTLQDEITKSVADFNPGNDQATLNLQALCRIIDNPDGIEEALKEHIFAPNQQNTSFKKERLNQEQFKILEEGLYELFNSEKNNYSSDIGKLLDKIKELIISTQEKYVKLIYWRYFDYKKAFSECDKKTPDQLFAKIIASDLEKGVPSLIRMDDDVMKRATARFIKEQFSLGAMDVASHTDFLDTLNNMHKLSSSLLFEYFRLTPMHELVSQIVDGEIEYNDKRRKDLIFSMNASRVNAAIQEGSYKTKGEYDMENYRAYCELKDTLRNQQHAVGRNSRDIWNHQMRIKSNRFFQHAIDFSKEFMFWWKPRYIVYKTIVRDGNKSVIIFSNGEFYQSEHIHQYEIGLTMVRTKNVDIMNDKKQLDEKKIMAVILRNNPNFKRLDIQKSRIEYAHVIGNNVIQGDTTQDMQVGTFTQTHTLSTNTYIETIPGDYHTGIPSYFPTSGNDELSYQEFFFQPPEPRDVPPYVQTQIDNEKRIFLPDPFVAHEAPGSAAAATALTSPLTTYRSSNLIDDDLRKFVSPFTNNPSIESSLPEPALRELQERILEHLSFTIGKDIVTINNENQVTYYQSGGKVISYDKKNNVSAKDAKQGNYTTALPEHIIRNVHRGDTILLKVDGQKYSGIRVQDTDAGFTSSVIPDQPEYRDSLFNSKLLKLAEPIKPLVEKMFPAVMNAAYSAEYGKVLDNKTPIYPLARVFLEQLNRTAGQSSSQKYPRDHPW